MKRSILTAVLAVFALGVSAKEDEVPAAVKTKFASLYPDAKKVEWEKEGANYEAEFEVNKTETCVLFDANGNVLETESEIEVASLPAGIADYIAKNYPGQKLKETSKIVTGDGAVMYEVEVKGGNLLFDVNGNFLKKDDKDDDGDKDDDKD